MRKSHNMSFAICHRATVVNKIWGHYCELLVFIRIKFLTMSNNIGQLQHDKASNTEYINDNNDDNHTKTEGEEESSFISFWLVRS
jgi:hypothetical protein